MSEVAVSVVVPARDAAATIARALEAIAAQDLDQRFEVIVVDDGSCDDTPEIAEAAGARVLRQRGIGPGAARKLGVEEARGEVIAFTDADCFPTAGWLRAGLKALAGADLVQGRVIPDPGAERGPFDHTIWVVEESGLYETANLLVRRDLFLELGGFEDWLDVSVGKRLGEDVWFGWKARRAGARTAFASEALVHHAVFPRGWCDYVGERRRLRYFPQLVRKMPELRRHFLWGRLSVSPRSAAFAAAALGLLASAIAALAGLGAPAVAPLALAAPYAWIAGRRLLGLGRHGPWIVAVEALADAVGLASLLRGSLGTRTLVL